MTRAAHRTGEEAWVDTREQSSPETQPLVEAIPVGMLAANCYLVTCPETLETVVVDPGADPSVILDRIAERGLRVVHILHTHGHFDHISATEAVLAGLPGPVPVLANPADAYLYAPDARAAGQAYGYAVAPEPVTPRWELVDGATLRVGQLTVRVVSTPGHTPGSVCLLWGDTLVLSGDTLFHRGIGRTDLAGGDEDAIYTSITERLYALPDAVAVLPGHGPVTTIGEERRQNPFVRGLG